MINQWMGLGLEIRISILALIGLFSGALANYLIYTHAYFARPISPWATKGFLRQYLDAIKKQEGKKHALPDRSWIDCVPVVGWLRLRRESEIHGRGFWVRPFLIELAMAVAIPALYQFEVLAGGLLPGLAGFPGGIARFESTFTTIFFSHAILLTFMAAATFIDFDEQTIPDIITIPGTLIGLLISSSAVVSFMPTSMPVGGGMAGFLPTAFDSPWFQAPHFSQSPSSWAVGILIWTVWCFALADRRWSFAIVRRRGWGRAVNHFVNGLFHYKFWRVLALIWAIGAIGITGICRSGGFPWYGLFTALVGLAVGGGVVWAVRIVATYSLGMEAMGFGDVTLMAMIGTYIGWQGSVIAFGLAPFTAIVIVLVQYVITRNSHVPFGPYLVAGTLVTIIYWDRVYNQTFAPTLLLMGGFVLGVAIVLMVMMAAMLIAWRAIKQRFLMN